MTRLEVDGLTKSYGNLRALDGVSFSVEAGEIFGFVGSNGAGKTTTMRIILGVLSSDGGEVRWRGEPLNLDARRRVGYMPEERGLYPKMRVGEQLIHLARLHGLSREDANSAMERWTETLGIAARRGDEVQKLSLGNQQRVQLAAALVHDPDVLILDEPFSGLDPVAVDVMSTVLRERAATGVPTVFSSHQLDLVEQLCDRVGIIQAGRMVADGTVDELRTSTSVSWRVRVPDASSDWALGVPGAGQMTRADDGAFEVDMSEAAPGAEQELLRTAQRTGPVLEFSRVRPSLTDLFRHVVTEAEPEEPA